MWRSMQRDEHGAAAIFLAITITSVLLAAAFAVDLGWWYVRAQQAQRTADAASLAGVTWMPGDFPKARSVALAVAEANGFKDGANSISVIVTRGSTDRQLSVRIVDGGVARFFSSLASKEPVSIGRQAVAQYELPIPLGSPENQFGGGNNGVFLAVNGFCSRRQDGDNVSAGYNDTTNPKNFTGAQISCSTPYATASPSGSTAKNPDYRSTGYTYVVQIPPAPPPGTNCAVASPPASCSQTASPVTIQVQDPKLNTNTGAPQADQYGSNFPFLPAGCTAPGPGTTTFTVLKADTTPFDDTDNTTLAGPFDHGPETSTSAAWEPLVTVPAGSLAGRYLVRVQSKVDQRCAAWSNAFGIRARVGGTWASCSSIPMTPLPAGYTFCPTVQGSDAMSLRVVMATASVTCAGTKETGANKCATFYLAQVDPVYAGRQMLIKLFDPGEGARRMRVLKPDGTPIGFDWKTVDSQAPASGSPAAMTGLDVFAPTPTSTAWPFNDRKLELAVTLPNEAGLAVNGGWFTVEYEVSENSAVGLVDRTTWGVSVRGAPVHLVL